ncbi:MAG: hypothetical protein RLZZ244_614, partial [Verrucomicrobiota bacterium]
TTLARNTRLRWVAAARSESESWDAFDAPEGTPLLNLPPQPWETLRSWLADLTNEFARATKDGSLPASASLAQIWIAPHGPALLLDEPAPDSLLSNPAPPEQFPIGCPREFQAFLHHLTAHSLRTENLPLHAHEFLDRLAKASFETTDFLRGQLLALQRKRTRISTSLKTILLTAAPLLIAIISLGMVLWTFELEVISKRRWAARPELRPLESYAVLAGILEPRQMDFLFADTAPSALTPEQRAHALQLLSAEFGPFILSPEFAHTPPINRWDPEKHAALRKAVSEHPPVSESERAAATLAIHPLLPPSIPQNIASFSKPIQGVASSLSIPPRFLGTLFLLAAINGVGNALALALAALTQLGSLLAIRTPLGAHFLGLCILGPDGRPASRPRLLLRWTIVWGGLLAPLLALLLPFSPLRIPLLCAASLAYLVCFLLFLFRQGPGLHEVLSQTRLTRR